MFGRDLENLPEKIQELDLSGLAERQGGRREPTVHAFIYLKSVTSEVFGVTDGYLGFCLNLTRKLGLTIGSPGCLLLLLL